MGQVAELLDPLYERAKRLLLGSKVVLKVLDPSLPKTRTGRIWAHARRHFYDAKETDHARMGVVLAMIARLYGIEKLAQKTCLWPALYCSIETPGTREPAHRFRDDENPDALGKCGEGLVTKYMDDAAPLVEPAAVVKTVAGEIGGVPVYGIVDLIDVYGRIIDLKTRCRKPSGISTDEA